MTREKVGRKRGVEEEEEEAGSGKVELSLGGGDGNGAATVGARSEAKSREAQLSGLGNTTTNYGRSGSERRKKREQKGETMGPDWRNWDGQIVQRVRRRTTVQ
jgi:hypothetical protein